MRYIGSIGLFLLLACSAAGAEPATGVADTSSMSVPSSTDVIAQLYQFDLFQQNAIDSAESSAIPDIVNIAATRADAAIKRDKILNELQRQAGIQTSGHKNGAAVRAHALAGADNSDGPAYVREFHQAQLVEYEAAIAVLERYVQSPDNEDVGGFAAAQLPILRAELNDTRNALSDK